MSRASDGTRTSAWKTAGIVLRAAFSGGPVSRKRTTRTMTPRPVAARHARKGITLFEAVASVAIVGAVSAAALSAVGSQYRTTARAQRALVVEALATSRLDLLELLSADRDLQSLPDTVAQGEFPAPLDEYKWKTTVSPVSDEAGLYNVRITVLWKDGQYQLKSRAYRRPALQSANR